MRKLFILVLLLVALAPVASSAQAPAASYPTVLIQNESGQHVQVFDGPFLIASLMPGEQAKASLRNKSAGARVLRVRSVTWISDSRSQRFETNSNWRLE